MTSRTPITHIEIARAVEMRMKGMHPETIARIMECKRHIINKLLSEEKKWKGYNYPPLFKVSSRHIHMYRQKFENAHYNQ